MPPNSPPTDTQLRRKLHPEWYRKLKTEANAIRRTGRWKKVSRMFRKSYPVCCNPLDLHPRQVRSTAHAHHIIPIEEAPELAFDWSNLAPLYAECYGAVEAIGPKGRVYCGRAVS